MSEVFDYEFYCGASWNIYQESGGVNVTTHQTYTATIKFQYTYDGNLNPRDLFICQVTDLVDREGREYSRFVFPTIKPNENVTILNYEGSRCTYTVQTNDDPPQTTNSYDDAAIARVRSLQPIMWKKYSERIGLTYDAKSLYISNLDIRDDQTTPWTYRGYAFKNGKYYDSPLDMNNPYEDEDADDDGGPGTNDWDTDQIDELDLPPDYYGNSGMVTIYTPTSAELRALSEYLWSNNGLDISQFKKIVNNPFDLILGLNWIPFRVTSNQTIGVNVGNILGVDTGLTMHIPTKENYIFDFGTIDSGLASESKSFVAYSPYTRMSISIPFIGKQSIDPDLIRKNLPVNLKMKYNIVNGTICAYLYGDNKQLLYQWVGSVPSTIPVAQNDHTQSIAGMMSIAAGCVSGAVTGAIAGGGLGGAAVGGLIGAVQGTASADLKPTITTSGSYSGNGSSLNATGQAYIEVIQSKLSIASNHRHYLGYPRNTAGEIGKSYGFNSVKAVRVGVKRATDSEKDELKQILESGYIYGDIETKDDGTKEGVVTPKPAVIADDSLQLMLYQTGSSNIRLDKSCTHLHTYSTLTLKEPCSIQEPIVKLSASDTNVKKGNYCYIPKFDRFYYITNVVSLPGGLWELNLRCDVLMSFREELLDNNVVFNHSEWKWNLYLNDGSLQVDSRPKIKLKRFPNELDVTGSYVLIMAGQSSESSGGDNNE